MKLSIVIVNYNVKHFLEQCLWSVYKATQDISAEIFVVDNNSVDGSCAMVNEKFPTVNLIANKENVGYAAANNMAIRKAKGTYILLLNPDTLVEEDTFTKCLSFMDNHQDAGALGVKMIDGKGNFLPESKRGLPTPWVAFYKVFGLASLFPRSKRFGQYHLRYLHEDETHEVDVLCGAFMLMRKEALDNVGLLDETFFMYGEDIDLSYRIQLGGYKVYYYPETTIIHYKGESTKKGSLNYVRIFYNAMIIFARKHFSGKHAFIYSFIIKLAIYLRAAVAVIRRIINRVSLPIVDILLFYLCFIFILPYWEKIRYEVGYYPEEYLQLVIPSYILLWISSIWLNGGYERPISIGKLWKGTIWGTITLLVIYSLLPDTLRYSRAMLLIGAVAGGIALTISRFILSKIPGFGLKLRSKIVKSVLIVGDANEVTRIKQLLTQSNTNVKIKGSASLNGNPCNDSLGTLDQLQEIIHIHHIDEVIFCSEDIPAETIISQMLRLANLSVQYKIAPPKSQAIIGSNSIHTAGDLYLINLNSLNKPENKRSKRLFDILTSAIILTCWPLLAIYTGKPRQLFKNIACVMTGRMSWIGFSMNSVNGKLQKIKPGVLTPADQFDLTLSKHQVEELNMNYARNYNILHDFRILMGGMKKLGRVDINKTI
ncbi:glycosyltransferase [Puteibacter caeruleilacunae]|nr:glycosyltransferase [Puteibacter caeruleilacunae]